MHSVIVCLAEAKVMVVLVMVTDEAVLLMIKMAALARLAGFRLIPVVPVLVGFAHLS